MLSNNVVIRIDDNFLLENNIVNKLDIVPIDLKSLSKKIQIENIKQGPIGNCGLLVGIGSVIDKCPDAISNIVIANGNTVEVKLHDETDPSVTFTYIMDPTKIDISRNTHDAIFLIEKAYAIHRILKANQLDKSEAKNKREKCLNYKEALEEIYPANVYTALLGIDSTIQPITDQSSAEYLLTTFIPNLLPRELMEGSQELATIEKMFGTKDCQEAQLFLKLIDPMFHIKVVAKFEDLKLAKKSMEVREFLKEVFNEEFNLFINNEYETSENKELMRGVAAKFNHFLDTEVPYQRGLGIYTAMQLEIYQSIKIKLENNQLLSLATKINVGRKQNSQNLFAGESISKGLVGKHAYQIVNCYERENLKYVLVRNPWGSHVRGYQPKEKIINGKKVTVLSAYQKDNFQQGMFGKVLSFFNKAKITNPALPLSEEQYNDKYKGNGYFELELSDLTKRFSSIHSAKNDRVMDKKVTNNK